MESALVPLHVYSQQSGAKNPHCKRRHLPWHYSRMSGNLALVSTYWPRTSLTTTSQDLGLWSPSLEAVGAAPAQNRHTCIQDAAKAKATRDSPQDTHSPPLFPTWSCCVVFLFQQEWELQEKKSPSLRFYNPILFQWTHQKTSWSEESFKPYFISILMSPVMTIY